VGKELIDLVLDRIRKLVGFDFGMKGNIFYTALLLSEISAL